jgi:carbonic anhydrase/acetyltransferase-like protein (isoleucine patch superfamily)
MSNLKPFTKIPENSWAAKNSTLIGNIQLHGNNIILFNSVIRADNDFICIGNGTNIQDGCILHADDGVPLKLGENVTVGHMSMLHGCSIGSNTLIGINAIILNGSEIGDNCIIAANSLIPENKIIPSNSVVMGSPGKIVREATPSDLKRISENAKHYIKQIPIFKKSIF